MPSPALIVMSWSKLSLVLVMAILLTPVAITAADLSGPVAIISNSIDRPAATKLQKALMGMGIDAEVRSPEHYDESFSWAKIVVVLGGHKAPEGIGKIVGKMLTDREKEFLEKPYNGYYFFRRIGKVPVVIIAGNTRVETYEVVDTFILKGLDDLRRFLANKIVVIVPPY